MQVCTSLQTDNHTSTPPLWFLQAGCPSCRPTNSVKALKVLLFHPIYRRIRNVPLPTRGRAWRVVMRRIERRICAAHVRMRPPYFFSSSSRAVSVVCPSFLKAVFTCMIQDNASSLSGGYTVIRLLATSVLHCVFSSFSF